VPRLRSTRGCPVSIRGLLALEEAAVVYETTIVEDGVFRRRYGLAGPVLEEDEGYEAVGIAGVLRHVARVHGGGALWPTDPRGQAEADRWIETHQSLARTIAADPAGARPVLVIVDAALGGREWMLGGFSIADCSAAALAQQRARLPLDGLGRLDAYLARLMARPAWARADARAPR
jgi:glutathione S-transferase